MSEDKEKSIVVQPLHMDPNTQALIARDNSELSRMIRVFMGGMAFPATLDTEPKIIAAWQVAASLKLPPMVAIQNMAVIHGTVAIWGQLPKALAEQTGQMEEFKLILFDGAQKVINLENKNLGEDVWGAVTQMRRSKRSLNEYYFTEVEAKKAGLLNKKGPWTDYRKIMYARRTMGHACKFEFPDALMGVPVAEYDFHEAPDLSKISNVTPRVEQANQFWKEVSDGPQRTRTEVESALDAEHRTQGDQTVL